MILALLAFSCGGSSGKPADTDKPDTENTDPEPPAPDPDPEPDPEPKADTLQLRVMSFNILQSKDEAAGHTWTTYRAEPCKQMFKATDPDIICLQECRRTQFQFMTANFPDYDYFLYAKDGIKKAGYESIEKCTDDVIFKNGGHRDVIAVRAGNYELLDWGRYWFSETPDVSSYAGIYEGGGTPKLSLWIKLKDKNRDFVFFVWCTHFFPHGDIPTRTLCSTMSIERMKQQVQENDVVFFCGDLNLAYESEALAPMNEWMKNARIEAASSDNHPTYTGFRTDASTWTLIDHIYYRNATPLAYRVVSEPISGGTSVCSDHFPIYSDFQVIIKEQ